MSMSPAQRAGGGSPEDLEKAEDIPHLETYLSRQKEELANRELELRNLQAVVAALKASIAFHSGLLVQLKEPGGSVTQVENRSPTEMLFPQYKGKKLADVVIEVLGQLRSCTILDKPNPVDV